MKKIITILLILCIVSLTGCRKTEIKPDEVEIRNICDLATLEVEYNNVAKYTRFVKGWFINSGNLKVWIQYKGSVKLGIDMSKVKMSVEDNVVKITIPQAEVLNISIIDDSYNEDSFIFENTQLIDTQKLSPEEITSAINTAQQEIEEKIGNQNDLLVRAQNRAKVLIENYIDQLSSISGIDYTIEWEYV